MLGGISIVVLGSKRKAETPPIHSNTTLHANDGVYNGSQGVLQVDCGKDGRCNKWGCVIKPRALQKIARVDRVVGARGEKEKNSRVESSNKLVQCFQHATTQGQRTMDGTVTYLFYRPQIIK